MTRFFRLLPVLMCLAGAAKAQTPAQGDWTAPDFRFHTGQVMALKQHYVTLGNPDGAPVLILHGTGGTGEGMLTPAFAGALFGPGQPLDARRYFIILPDGIGSGKSSRPSDGLRTRFPHYNYDDMVAAQYRLVTEGLGLKHLRLVLGISGGGMLTWLWSEQHPGFMDGLVPLASQPSAMAARNWMLRRLLVETIRSDPGYHDGNYQEQPRSMKLAAAFFGIATSGGTQGWQKQAPTRAQADALVDQRLAQPFTADANDYIYSWESSRDYDPAPQLEKITAPLLAVNSADDERNPPETGVTAANMRRVRKGRLYLIPASGETRGHGTAGQASLWAGELAAFLSSLP